MLETKFIFTFLLLFINLFLYIVNNVYNSLLQWYIGIIYKKMCIYYAYFFSDGVYDQKSWKTTALKFRATNAHFWGDSSIVTVASPGLISKLPEPGDGGSQDWFMFSLTPLYVPRINSHQLKSTALEMSKASSYTINRSFKGCNPTL